LEQRPDAGWHIDIADGDVYQNWVGSIPNLNWVRVECQVRNTDYLVIGDFRQARWIRVTGVPGLMHRGDTLSCTFVAHGFAAPSGNSYGQVNGACAWFLGYEKASDFR
jgi:hypothetical protein